VKAMILAAGLGTRLRPLTSDRPKALVEIGGRTLLEITITRLRDFGIRDVIVNAHHFAGMIVEYLHHNDFGMRIAVSCEEELLDTGGGLKKAADFFLQDGSGEPFLLHNVDVISTIDFSRMVSFHREHKPLVTLAVHNRESSRYLLFDRQSRLRGRQDQAADAKALSSNPEALAFSGIHVISPQIFAMMSEQGAFSIIDCYLRLAAAGERILAFRADSYDWQDLGTPERVREAALKLPRSG
jgi:NDP-sugar pyrophosphorylase family protein